MKFTQPEIDSQLKHMEQLELTHTQAFLRSRLPLILVIAVPQQAEGLGKNRRAQEKQHQESEGNVVLFLVKVHNGQNIQSNVQHQENQAQGSEEEIHGGECEVIHYDCQT